MRSRLQVREIRERTGIDARYLPPCLGARSAEQTARLRATWRDILAKASASSRPRQPLVLDDDFDVNMHQMWARYGHADTPLPPDPGYRVRASERCTSLAAPATATDVQGYREAHGRRLFLLPGEFFDEQSHVASTDGSLELLLRGGTLALQRARDRLAVWQHPAASAETGACAGSCFVALRTDGHLCVFMDPPDVEDARVLWCIPTPCEQCALLVPGSNASDAAPAFYDAGSTIHLARALAGDHRATAVPKN